MTETERLNKWITLILWGVLLAGSMGLMLYTASHKTIVIADSAYERDHLQTDNNVTEVRHELLLRQESADDSVFYIPLGKRRSAADVVIENCYAQKELRISIRGAGEDFFRDRDVWGDITPIRSATWETQSGGVTVRLVMDGIYEYQSSIEESHIKVMACAPHDIYRMLVVIDPAGGGSDAGLTAGDCTEKELALSVAKLIQKKLKSEEIRLYFTRTEDALVSDEERCELAQDAGADLFIRLGASADDDGQKYGITGRYNASYFIPEFGNVQLADTLTRNVTVAAKNRAVGLTAADEDSILQSLSLPAAQVELGYLTNPKECALLVRQEYRELLAEGIANAIEEVCKNYYE